MKKSKKTEEDYDKLIDYCTDKKWEVVEEEGLECKCEDDGTITLGMLISQPLKLFSLLHEIGHLTLWRQSGFDDRFPGYQKSERHKHFKAATVEEEIKAWDEGLKVAQELDIELDMKAWHRHRYDCIYSYIQWAKKKSDS